MLRGFSVHTLSKLIYQILNSLLMMNAEELLNLNEQQNY